MDTFIVILIITAVSVGLMMLGLSITQIRKGRPIQGDVGSNDDMKRLGLECTAQQFRREERGSTSTECETKGCTSCKSC